MRQCEICKKHNARICNPCIYAEQTVFEKITQSPKVLAGKLVYAVIEKGLLCFRSTLIAGMLFATREDAHAATVARLREVAE